MKTSHYPLFGNACLLALHHDNVRPLELKATHKNERLRTFLVMRRNGSSEVLILDKKLFYNLKFARVLDLSNIGLLEMPNLVSYLMYIQYLNVSGNRIQSLPRSVYKLLALQMLKLSNCPKLALPDDMKNLSNLKHLVFYVEGELRSIPQEFGKLTTLQTLTAFVVGNKKGHCIEELKKMDSLRGSLFMKNIENVINAEDAKDAKLDTKPYLNKLRLLWKELKDGHDWEVRENILEKQAQVLENLRPHRNLKEMEIKNYSGVRCPNWLSDSCRKFTRIHLQGLSYCTELPSFGRIPHLKSLIIGEMRDLECVDDNFYGDGNGEKFPSLEFLEVYQMPKLVQWKVDSNGSICMRSVVLLLSELMIARS
ncbi:hypothetical protein BUALT_Bualt12G0042100 [Buddleja alternifolia]|uniref:R13L1/DRL21-like LRR repeat region domain-containing protein n=1 Tax=Buddleja alternifolia TaxID=168488 RepID=A0AAV6WZ67_9LAMI|nr:hypothetical protein BUALT_Bualt12G0042100 [Buddleja alternifolia]